MTTFPKSIEAPITRFFHTPITWSKGVRNGGMTAVLKPSEGDWNDVLVYQPDSPGENWWDLVPRGTVIRASIREPGKKNPKDLIAFALPLKNQPTATQELIKSLQSEEITEETKPGLTHSDMLEEIKRLKDHGQKLTPSQKMFDEQSTGTSSAKKSDGDKLEERLKEQMLKKQHLATLEAYLPRLQMLVDKGEWADDNESGLLMAQAVIARALREWSEDHSPSADSTFTTNVLDACNYIVDVMVPLRSALVSDKQQKGTLSVPCGQGSSKTVLDLKHFR